MSLATRVAQRSRGRRLLSSALLTALLLLLVLPEAAGQTPRKAATTLPLRVLARPASGAYAERGDSPSSIARHKWKDHHEAEREDDNDDDDDDDDDSNDKWKDKWKDHHEEKEDHGQGHGTPTPTGTPEPTGTPTPTGTPEPTGTPTPTGSPTPAFTGGDGDAIPQSEDSDTMLSDATLIDRVCDSSATAADVWLAVLDHADANGDGALDYAEFRALVAKSMGSSWKTSGAYSSSGPHHHETKRPTRTQTPNVFGVAPRPGSAVRPSSGRRGEGKDPLRREWACDTSETVEDKVRALFDAMDERELGVVGFGDGDDESLGGVPFLVSMVTMQYVVNALE